MLSVSQAVVEVERVRIFLDCRRNRVPPGAHEQVWKSGRALGDPADLAASSHAHLQSEGKCAAHVLQLFFLVIYFSLILIIRLKRNSFILQV